MLERINNNNLLIIFFMLVKKKLNMQSMFILEKLVIQFIEDFKSNFKLVFFIKLKVVESQEGMLYFYW